MLVPDYAWGHDCLKDFKDALAESPLKDGEIKPFIHKFGEADFSSTIQQIVDYKPDGLVSASWAGDMVTFVRQQKPYELFKKMVGFQYGNSVGLAKALGNEMEPMWSGMDQGHPSLPPGKKFNEMFIKEYNEWVTEDTAACYYDSLFILKNAIEKANSAKPEDIAKAMEGLEYHRVHRMAEDSSSVTLAVEKGLSHGLHRPAGGCAILDGHGNSFNSL